jgi:hypothetical protein
MSAHDADLFDPLGSLGIGPKTLARIVGFNSARVIGEPETRSLSTTPTEMPESRLQRGPRHVAMVAAGDLDELDGRIAWTAAHQDLLE